MHGLELHGELQKVVIEYRQNKDKYERYHEMLTDLYREELEHWINENQVINLRLKKQ